MSSALLARTLARVAGGILANAALSGANTVMFDAELSVSTSPAFFTAVTSVDSTGLAEAAVATGAAAMPLKLPAPDFGTDEQAGPEVHRGGRRRTRPRPAPRRPQPPTTPGWPRGRGRGAAGAAGGRAEGEADGETGYGQKAMLHFFTPYIGFTCGYGLVPSRGCGAVT